MIKYIGSKRRLVPVLGDLASAVGARSCVDLFTGTTRVAQELKERGMHVTAIEAADRVDSTTGVQMAYVKQWAPRSFRPLALRVPELLPGTGVAVRGDACELAGALGSFDFAYLDPPYNQHRYFTNYHIWETLVAWDAPEHYGVACKRVDARDVTTKSVFNDRRAMPAALAEVIANVDAELLVVSYNNESWVTID